MGTGCTMNIARSVDFKIPFILKVSRGIMKEKTRLSNTA